MQIEYIRPEPSQNEQVFEYCEHLRREIARHFAVPAYLMEPKGYRRLQLEAWHRTEAMRAELNHLVMTHCWDGFRGSYPNAS